MADLRIVDAPVLLQESITDDVKMPTGGLGNFSVRLGDILWYVITKEQLANKSYVDLSSKGVQDKLDTHIADKTNPHQVTKEQVGLGNVDNTADIDKPVSNATKSAIITATTDMATKAYVNSKDGDLTTLTTTDKTSLVKAINEVVSVKANKADVASSVSNLTNNKADKATTLVGYGISDAYTKSEIDTNYNGVKTLYDKNVEAGAGAKGWTTALVVEGGETQKQINAAQRQTNQYIAQPYNMPVGVYTVNSRVKLDNGDIVRSVISKNIDNPNINMSWWETVEVSPNRLAIAEIKNNSKFNDFLRDVAPTTNATIYITKTDNNLFEILTPFVEPGRYLKWRFENKESNFTDASPSDTSKNFNRPFLQTTVQDVYLELRENRAFSDFVVSGASIVSGNFTYIKNIGDSLTVSGVRAKRLRLDYFAAINSGKIKVTINGNSKLVNLIQKDANGDAIIDTYSNANTSQYLFIANNLPDIDLEIKIEVVGKNNASTDSRYYALTAAGYTKHTPYNGVGSPVLTVSETLKIGGSAVDYAVSFHPASKPNAADSWGGSVHGWENRKTFELLLDNASYNLSGIAIGTYVAARLVQIKQTTDIFHNAEIDTVFAEVDSIWNINSNGAQQGYTFTWRNASIVANGYSQMWTVAGGSTGGAGGAKNGWCDRVIFGDGSIYDLSYGGMGEFGKVLANEILFFGTKPLPSETSRNRESGDTACLVNIASLSRSFRGFINNTSIKDGVWVQDRPTFKKMYAQIYRAAGTLQSGDYHKGLMSIKFYKIPNISSMII